MTAHSVRFSASTLFRLVVLWSAALLTSCDCNGAKLSAAHGDIGVVSENASGQPVVSRDAVFEFGAVPIGQTRTLKLVVRNVGSASLRLAELTFVKGDATTVGAVRAATSAFGVAFMPTTISPGAEVQFDMEFAPSRSKSSASAELVLKAEGTSDGAETARIVLNGSAGGCGNLVVESTETCDPPSSCPTSCADSDQCTTDALLGSADSCTAQCRFSPVTQCVGGDGCCPSLCTAATDSDCIGCGNGKLEGQETCDPPNGCAPSCDDGNTCSSDTMSGSAATCDVKCSHEPVTVCRSGDGCCPPGCSGLTDSDCSGCGNLVIDASETCDPPSSCPTACSDGNSCTADALIGAAAACTAACRFTAISSCVSADGCCPASCSAMTDADCAGCGNGRLEPGEVCDPPGTCPSSCSDGNACTSDVMMGSASTCTASCSHTPIVACRNGDGCCPSGCNGLNDTDCTGCGNQVCDAPQETCFDCVQDCGSGYTLDAPNVSCMGPTVFSAYGKWCGTELIIAGTYTSTSGTIDVEVNRTHSFILALTSHDAAQWSVRLNPGHQLQKILVSGSAAQTVVFLGAATVPVEHYDGPGIWFGCGDFESPGCDANALRAKAEATAGAKATYYVGCPKMASATIN